MRSSDLGPLFGNGGGGLGFRQGTVLTWNPSTAENTVDVGGTTLTNLPILNTSEAALLGPGAVVSILTDGASWGILGRFTVPGTADAASALTLISQRIVAASDPAQGVRTSSSFGDLTGAAVGPSVTATISSSGKALVFWSAEYGGMADLSWEAWSTAGISVEVSGATSRSPSGSYALGYSLAFPPSPNPGNALHESIFQNSLMHLFEGLNPGSNTFTLKYRNNTNSNDVKISTREIAVFAL